MRFTLLLLLACSHPPPPAPAPGSSSPPASAPAPAPGSSSPPAPAPAPGSSPSASPSPSPPPSAPVARPGSPDEIAFCISETNRHRAFASKPPLSRNTLLDSFAADAARVDHQSGSPHRHINTTPFPADFRSLAANELPRWHYDGPDSVKLTLRTGLGSFWAEGPGGGHYENIVGNFTELGCGIWIEGDAITVVQIFRLP